MGVGGGAKVKLFYSTTTTVISAKHHVSCVIFITLSSYLYLFHNKPYSTAIGKNNRPGRTKLTALTAAVQNRKIKYTESDWRCHQQQLRGAILSVSYPSVKVQYIGTRNVQLMHCKEILSFSCICWKFFSYLWPHLYMHHYIFALLLFFFERDACVRRRGKGRLSHGTMAQ